MYSLEYTLKVFFRGILSIHGKSGGIDQLTLDNRPVDRDRLTGHPCYRAALFKRFYVTAH